MIDEAILSNCPENNERCTDSMSQGPYTLVLIEKRALVLIWHSHTCTDLSQSTSKLTRSFERSLIPSTQGPEQGSRLVYISYINNLDRHEKNETFEMLSFHHAKSR